MPLVSYCQLMRHLFQWAGPPPALPAHQALFSSLPDHAMTPPSRQGAILLSCTTACALPVLDTNVVGIVLPAISRDLSASFAEITWVVSAYVLCFACLLLPAGALADRYGRRRLLLSGVTLFALASLACGLAPGPRSLYAARAFQGAGSALLLAPALAIIGHTFHEESAKVRAWAAWGALLGLAMVISPLLGGLVGGLLGWRWAFFMNVLVCALLLAAILRTVPESSDPVPRPLDLPGILLFMIGMFMLTSALIVGPDLGWSSTPVLVRVAAGLLIFGVFIRVESRRAHPMLDLSLFRAWPFVGAVIAMLAYAAAAQVMATLLPLFLQNGRGLTALMAGVAMLPFSLAMLLLPQVSRRLAATLDSRQLLALGLGVTMIGNLLLSWAAHSASLPLLVIGMAVLGSGGGLLNGETQRAIMGTLPRHRAGMASGISTTARFSGILLAFAGLGAVLAGGTRNALAQWPGAAWPEGFADRVVAGDLDRAVSLLPPEQAESALAIGQASYASGFSLLFLSAALLAGLATLFVLATMRHQADGS